jgi:hypothetical protein
MSADVFPKLMNYLVDSDRFTRAEMIAAVRIALEYHEPAHIHAGVGFDGPDRCTYCSRFGEPLAAFMGDVNGEWMLTHCHGYADWCAFCDGAEDYPCAPVWRICEALGVMT